MAALTSQTVSVTGLEATYAACAGGGDTFTNNGRTFVHIDNASGGDLTVTFDDTGSVSPAGATAFTPDVAVVVTAGESRFIGPFPTARFGTSVAVTYSGVTTLTIAVLQF